MPEKADFKYVTFDPETYKGEFITSDKEIENYFIQNKASFNEPERVRAAHILFRVENWDDEKAATEIYQKAKKVRKEIVDGADFAKMAEKYSEDSTAQNGGELGFFTRGQMVPEFENAAFTTNPGEVSDVVKTQFGFHIINVEEYIPSTDPTLDEVKDEIAALIKDQKSASSFRTHVYDTYKAILDKSNITAYNEQAETPLPVREIKGLTAAGNVEPLNGMPAVAKRLLALTKSEISQVLEVGEPKMIFEMTEKYDSYIPELEDIKEQVTADFVKVKSLELAKAKAVEASELDTMDDAANTLKESYTTTPKFKRTDPINGLGMNARLMGDIFKAEPGDFIKDVYTVGSNVYIVQVKDIIKPDIATMDDQTKEQIKSSLFGVKSNQAVQSYVENLKANAKIEINPRYSQFYN